MVRNYLIALKKLSEGECLVRLNFFLCSSSFFFSFFGVRSGQSTEKRTENLLIRNLKKCKSKMIKHRISYLYGTTTIGSKIFKFLLFRT